MCVALIDVNVEQKYDWYNQYRNILQQIGEDENWALTQEKNRSERKMRGILKFCNRYLQMYYEAQMKEISNRP